MTQAPPAPHPVLARPEALFARPRFLGSGLIALHLPVLFWLCAERVPRRALVAGVGDGMAHFALCQALEAGGSCTGYGTWAEAGGHVPAALRAHEELHHDRVSHLQARASAEAVLAAVAEEGAADLLLVDLAALGADVDADLAGLLAGLAPGGLLVLHGTRDRRWQDRLDGLAGQAGGQARHLALATGLGLWIVTRRGDTGPAGLERLFALAEGGDLPEAETRIFAQVGQGLLALAEAQAARDDRDRAEARALRAQRALDALALPRQEVAPAPERGETAAALDAARAEVTTLRETLDRLRAVHDRELAEMTVITEELHAALAARDAAADMPSDVSADGPPEASPQAVPPQATPLASPQAETAPAAEPTADLAADLAGARAEAADLRAELDGMRNSRAWRLTAPLRRLNRWRKGRAG